VYPWIAHMQECSTRMTQCCTLTTTSSSFWHRPLTIYQHRHGKNNWTCYSGQHVVSLPRASSWFSSCLEQLLKFHVILAYYTHAKHTTQRCEFYPLQTTELKKTSQFEKPPTHYERWVHQVWTLAEHAGLTYACIDIEKAGLKFLKIIMFLFGD